LSKWRHPEEYQRKLRQGQPVQGRRILTEDDLVLEFMMNRLRLIKGFAIAEYVAGTGLSADRLEPGLQQAMSRGLLETHDGWIEATPRGRLFLNDLLALFVNE
jgi:oxygen-independent coproporphyrinogen-3 oxidase